MNKTLLKPQRHGFYFQGPISCPAAGDQTLGRTWCVAVDALSHYLRKGPPIFRERSTAVC